VLSCEQFGLRFSVQSGLLPRRPVAHELPNLSKGTTRAMFDLTAAPSIRPLREPSPGSRLAAILVHTAGLIALIAVPVSRAVIVQPETPAIEAFVVTPDTLPPLPAAPPPPPAPAPAASAARAIEPPAAPREAPVEVQPEHADPHQNDAAAGPEVGVDGGIPGGVVGGVIGGLGSVAPNPLTLPAPPRPATPIRVSGAIKSPALLHRVEPVYSALAAMSHISGVVILEAVVDVNGSVESVTILRGRSPLLDNAATEALKQWRYAPLVLAGLPTPFAVTVTFNFSIPSA
jgi:periplasmic protein TonB